MVLLGGASWSEYDFESRTEWFVELTVIIMDMDMPSVEDTDVELRDRILEGS